MRNCDKAASPKKAIEREPMRLTRPWQNGVGGQQFCRRARCTAESSHSRAFPRQAMATAVSTADTLKQTTAVRPVPAMASTACRMTGGGRSLATTRTKPKHIRKATEALFQTPQEVYSQKRLAPRLLTKSLRRSQAAV